MGWVRRVLLGLIVSVVALAGLGAAYQTIAPELDQRNYPPPGQRDELADGGALDQASLIDKYSAEDRYVGSLVGVPYAEAFKARSPLLVDSPEVFLKARFG